MMLNGIIMDAGAIQGVKVVSSKEVEVRAVLDVLEKVWKNGFGRLRVLLDAQEVIHALKGGFDWSIKSIILDIKSLDSLFLSVDFEFIARALNEQAYRLANFCFSIRRDVEGKY